MKSYDEEAKRKYAFRECGVGATTQRTARSIPSELMGRKAGSVPCRVVVFVSIALRSGVVPFGATVSGVLYGRNMSGTAE